MTPASFLFRAISASERIVSACRRGLDSDGDRIEIEATKREFTEILTDLRKELAELTPVQPSSISQSLRAITADLRQAAQENSK